MAVDAGTPDPNAVRKATRDILNRSEFKPKAHHWWDTLWHYVTNPGDLLSDGFNWLLVHYFSSDVSQSILTWGITLVLGAMIVFLLLRFARSTSSDDAIPTVSPVVATTQTSKDLLADAKRYEDNGDWRNAIRTRYAALIARLSEDGIVQRRAGRTTGEYAMEVATNAPRAAERFRAATFMFEWVWYGDKVPQQSDCDDFRQTAESVRKDVAA